MIDHVITHMDQLTSTWLTFVLSNSRALIHEVKARDAGIKQQKH